jgi:hypothetical protein
MEESSALKGRGLLEIYCRVSSAARIAAAILSPSDMNPSPVLSSSAQDNQRPRRSLLASPQRSVLGDAMADKPAKAERLEDVKITDEAAERFLAAIAMGR